MKISTKGRYALRVMIYLCENRDEKLIPLKTIAADQEISLKYLEQIMTVLSKARFIVSSHGKGGGYKLKYPPEEYTVKSILELTESSLAPVACLEKNAEICPRRNKCKTLKMWQGLDKIINEYFESITLADIANTDYVGDYVI